MGLVCEALPDHPVALCQLFQPQQGVFARIGVEVVADALDNASREATIGLFETQAIHGPSWSDRREDEWQVARWVH